jgi:hypothetical protein
LLLGHPRVFSDFDVSEEGYVSPLRRRTTYTSGRGSFVDDGLPCVLPSKHHTTLESITQHLDSITQHLDTIARHDKI